MDVYIKRRDILSLIKKGYLVGNGNYQSVKNYINSIPAADVRPVVLCKDCIHFQQFRPHDGFCKIDGMLWNNDFFCANGKMEKS